MNVRFEESRKLRFRPSHSDIPSLFLAFGNDFLSPQEVHLRKLSL